MAADDARILITTGGTGITARDGTFEVATAIIEKPLPGFGEIFRMLSYQEIGAAAIRSTAGVVMERPQGGWAWAVAGGRVPWGGQRWCAQLARRSVSLGRST